MNSIFTKDGMCAENNLKEWLVQRGRDSGWKDMVAILDSARTITTRERKEGAINWIQCEIDGMPSQCGVCAFHAWNSYHCENLYKEHWAKCEKLASLLGYTKAMLTLVSTQHIEAFTELGFKEVDRFTNKRTTHTVVILTKDIPE